jgi:pSer/pThr/pTyr-binding forkhead associated (FHA) protein
MKNDQIIPELERITIGRSDDNRVKLTPTNIGRHHAVITITGSNVYLLEDLESKHGTYVNSEKIHRKLISGEDKISFANNHYVVREILEMAKIETPSSKQSNDDDYTEEFEKMKILWEQYQIFKSEEINIQNGIERMTEHLRLVGPMTGSTIALLSIVLGGPAILTTLSACGLTVLIPAIGSKFLGKDEKLSQPRLHFANNWKCPKCGDKTGLLNKSWELLAKQKNCTKCEAIWVK